MFKVCIYSLLLLTTLNKISTATVFVNNSTKKILLEGYGSYSGDSYPASYFDANTEIVINSKTAKKLMLCLNKAIILKDSDGNTFCLEENSFDYHNIITIKDSEAGFVVKIS